MPAQSEAAGVALSTEEATAFIKGKSHSATRLAGGTPSLQFKDNGTMYGNNGGSDSGSTGSGLPFPKITNAISVY